MLAPVGFVVDSASYWRIDLAGLVLMGLAAESGLLSVVDSASYLQADLAGSALMDLAAEFESLLVVEQAVDIALASAADLATCLQFDLTDSTSKGLAAEVTREIAGIVCESVVDSVSYSQAGLFGLASRDLVAEEPEIGVLVVEQSVDTAPEPAVVSDFAASSLQSRLISRDLAAGQWETVDIWVETAAVADSGSCL